jgi:hypothetical protein
LRVHPNSAAEHSVYNREQGPWDYLDGAVDVCIRNRLVLEAHDVCAKGRFRDSCEFRV